MTCKPPAAVVDCVPLSVRQRFFRQSSTVGVRPRLAHREIYMRLTLPNRNCMSRRYGERNDAPPERFSSRTVRSAQTRHPTRGECEKSQSLQKNALREFFLRPKVLFRHMLTMIMHPVLIRKYAQGAAVLLGTVCGQ